MFSQAFLSEGKATWWKLQSVLSLVRYCGGSEWLAWTCQWIVTAAVAVVLVPMWRSRNVRYSLKAASLAIGTMLITPYLFMYDMMVLAIPVAFLVRLGLASGFRATSCRRSAVRWRCCSASLSGAADRVRGDLDRGRTDPAPRWPLVAAGRLPAAVPASHRSPAWQNMVERHICFLCSSLNSCSVLHSDLAQIAQNSEDAFDRPSAGPRIGTRNAPWCTGELIKS